MNRIWVFFTIAIIIVLLYLNPSHGGEGFEDLDGYRWTWTESTEPPVFNLVFAESGEQLTGLNRWCRPSIVESNGRIRTLDCVDSSGQRADLFRMNRSIDGKRIILSSREGRIHIWSADSNEQVACICEAWYCPTHYVDDPIADLKANDRRLNGNTYELVPVCSAIESQCGEFLVASLEDGSIRVWRLKDGSYLGIWVKGKFPIIPIDNRKRQQLNDDSFVNRLGRTKGVAKTVVPPEQSELVVFHQPFFSDGLRRPRIMIAASSKARWLYYEEEQNLVQFNSATLQHRTVIDFVRAYATAIQDGRIFAMTDRVGVIQIIDTNTGLVTESSLKHLAPDCRLLSCTPSGDHIVLFSSSNILIVDTTKWRTIFSTSVVGDESQLRRLGAIASDNAEHLAISIGGRLEVKNVYSRPGSVRWNPVRPTTP